MSRDPIRSILVLGDGIVGLSAALAFSRALPWVEITILRAEPGPGSIADHFPATLPMVGRFHAAIGLDELDLVRRGVAVHHLGTRFTTGEHEWVHSFGEVGRNEGSVPFRQMWLGARQSGDTLAYDRYSPASMIGAAGKFVHPSLDPTSLLATYLYGLRLNPERYRATLEAATDKLHRASGAIAAIDRRDGRAIAAVTLDDGRRLEADLFVDCSGPGATLMSAMGGAFDDWSDLLPARHVSADWAEAGTIAPLDQVEAVEGGWRLTSGVPGATLRSSVTTGDRPGSFAIRPGRRPDSFVGNVVAFGDSAVALDPLLGTTLSLAHSAILRAIDLIPGRDCNPLELAEYNRLTTLETDRARDYHALFQSSLPGAAAVPPSLARTLAQWRDRGRLPFFEEESFTESSWAQMLIGLGILPAAVAPSAAGIDGAEAAAAMASLATEIGALVSRLPDYGEYLERMAHAPAGPART